MGSVRKSFVALGWGFALPSNIRHGYNESTSIMVQVPCVVYWAKATAR